MIENKENELQVDQALRNFRASVHAWSEQELNARPARVPVRQPRSHWFLAPAMGWGLAGILAIAAVGVPVGIQHERQLAATERAAQQASIQQQRQAEATSQAAIAVNDDELMSHVDSDIAQTTPDALQPLASLMADNNAQ